MKKILIAGNWKMNKTLRETEIFLEALLPADFPSIEGVICPPFTALGIANKHLRNSGLSLGAQNMDPHDFGAFTGEVSPLMLQELGVRYIILGHSERRTIFGESDECLRLKVKSAIEHRLMPILCVGETLEERERGITEKVIQKQLAGALQGLEVFPPLVIAYEPVWAIGTGKTATPAEAQQAHAFLRSILQNLWGTASDAIRILYGGSMNTRNAEDLLCQKDIDGGLIGGASLKAESFRELLAIAQQLSQR
ncbi:MAG: triose-phosphate isomerase [Puniceicoccales bacterium]|jgi:triosephosphate isomerase|nr:triose-phosphate isomerase [Puniceicoccales bacterium]